MILKASIALLTALLASSSITLASENPFKDVPKSSWAYPAIQDLFNKGIIKGYPNNYFNGDKQMTRFEMAQIIARAMESENKTLADKEVIDKLAAEFATELNNLGVRVANINKKIDNVKFTGKLEFRHYRDHDTGLKFDSNTNSIVTEHQNKYFNRLRFRMIPEVKINKNVKGYARINYDTEPSRDSDGKGVRVDRLYLEANLPTVKIQAGKLPMHNIAQGLLFNRDKISGVRVFTKNKITNGNIYIGRRSTGKGTDSTENSMDVYGIEFNHKASKKTSITTGYTMLRGVDKVSVRGKSVDLNSPISFNNGPKYNNKSSSDLKKGTINVGKLFLSDGINSSNTVIGYVDSNLNYSANKVVRELQTSSAPQYGAYVTSPSKDNYNTFVTAATSSLIEDTKNIKEHAKDNNVPLTPSAQLYYNYVQAYNKALEKARNQNIWYVTLTHKFDKNLGMQLSYTKNTKIDKFNDSYNITLLYKAKDTNKKGSYGAYLGYKKLNYLSSLQNNYDIDRGQQGWITGFDYVIDKNITYSMKYFSGKNILTQQKADRVYGNIEFKY